MQASMKALVISMVDVIFSGSVREVALPTITVILLVFFLRWVVAASKGESMNEMSADYNTVRESFAALKKGRDEYQTYRNEHPPRPRMRR